MASFNEQVLANLAALQAAQALGCAGAAQMQQQQPQPPAFSCLGAGLMPGIGGGMPGFGSALGQNMGPSFPPNFLQTVNTAAAAAAAAVSAELGGIGAGGKGPLERSSASNPGAAPVQPSEPESVQPGPSKEKEKEKCERDGEHFSEEDENDEKEAKDEPGPPVVKKYQDPKPKVRSKTPGKNEATEKQEEAEIAGGTHGEPAEDNGPKNEEPDENRQVHHPVRKVGQFAMDEDNVLEVFARVVPKKKTRQQHASRKSVDHAAKDEKQATSEPASSVVDGKDKPAEPEKPPKRRRGRFFLL